MKTKYRKIHRRFWRTFLQGYTRVAFIGLGVFALVGLFHPGFFSYGLRQLTIVFASDLNVNALVLPPPVKPVVTSSLSCNPLNLAMSLDLNWSLDSGHGTYTFDIYRNGQPLVIGLPATTTHYLDTNMAIATPYTYVVRANGPMGPGFEEADPVILTTPYNCDGLTPPTVAVTMFNGRPLASYKDQTLYNTHKRRPVLIGTTNVPYADVQIVINTETKVVAHVTANLNGYWEWYPTKRFNYERSTMYITATDPLNSTRYATTNFRFQIVRPEESSTTVAKEDSAPRVPQGALQEKSGNKEVATFTFDTFHEEMTYKQGDTVQMELTPRTLPQSTKEIITNVEYQLVDTQGEFIAGTQGRAFLRDGETVKHGLEIPLFVRPGKYTLSATFEYQGVVYTQSKTIEIQSVPVIKLSSGRDITYDEFMWNIGWVSFVFLTTLLIWFFLVFYEYWLFMKGKLTVDELNFKKAGYLSRL